MQPARTLVDVQYRKNLREFNQWEDEQRRKQAEAVAALIRRERRPIRVPRWVPLVASILVCGALVWLFVTLAFHLPG